MAWVVVDLDGCLLQEQDDGMGNVLSLPTDGAVESMLQLTSEGHRLTVYTSRFAPMPDDRRQLLKEQIEQELSDYGFPPMEVWTGTTKPMADIFIGGNHITFDNDWGLVLAQAQVMMEDMGLVPGPMAYGEPEVMEEGVPPEQDFLDEIESERTIKNPDFPKKVDVAQKSKKGADPKKEGKKNG